MSPGYLVHSILFNKAYYLYIQKGGRAFLGRHHDTNFWVGNSIIYIMWTIWRECNQHTFEGIERSPLEIKLIFLQPMYHWMVALSGLSFTNLEDFLDI